MKQNFFETLTSALIPTFLEHFGTPFSDGKNEARSDRANGGKILFPAPRMRNIIFVGL